MKSLQNSKLLRVLAVAMVIAIVAGGWILYGLEKADQAGVEVTTATPVNAQVIDQTRITAAAKKAMPSVVAVASTKEITIGPSRQSPFFDDPFFRRFFDDMPDQQRKRPQHGLGSGVIVRQEGGEGYILTNAHVIAEADDIKVTLHDDTELKAEVIGMDEGSDVAMLKIEADNLPVLPLADSDKAEVGNIVLAIGSPFGLGSTVTMGIISAKGRADLTITDYADFIQTDAAINPGNSGGALINLDGDLVGINTAILSRTGGYQGIGFAIPSNLARRVMSSLIEHGEIARGWLGVHIQDIDEALAEQLDLNDTKGVAITSVEPGSPAADAKLQEYDVIRKVNGKAVNSRRALVSIIGIKEPDTEVELEMQRNGKALEVTVTLGKRPTDLVERGPNGATEILSGIYAGDVTPELRDDLQLPKDTGGVVIVKTDGEKMESSVPLQPGDMIIAVNRQGVASVEQAQKAIKASNRDKVLLLVKRGRSTTFATVKK